MTIREGGTEILDHWALGPWSLGILRCSICLLWLAWPTFAAGDSPPAPALLDNMDGQKTILKHLPGVVRTEIVHQAVDRQHYRFGSGAERIRLACPSGSSALLAYPLPHAPVINELRVSAWVLCNRPGMQVAATVVLPRSVNLSTGRPYEILVRGGTLGRGIGWEQLSLSRLPELVERMTRVARVQHESPLDERGAYVSQVVLLAPGGQGLTECLIDQIQIFGILGSQGKRKPLFTVPRPNPKPREITFQIPQIIQWQGEPFSLLTKLGFDAVGMKRLPSPDELQEAAALGLAIVCPPPTPRQLTQQGIPDELSSVFAWDLGDQLSSDDLDHIIRWQELIKRFDPIDSRPTVITPRLFTREASRLANVLVVGRAMLGTDISLQEQTAWLTQQRRLARPGTDIWTTLDTQLNPAQALQMAAMQLPPHLTSGASYQQLSALTSAAFAVKSHGFYYLSTTSLAATDSATQRRAKAIQLNNLRLKLAEPWLASGKVLDVARSSQPQLTALVLKAERSHLLVPIRWSNSMASTQALTQPLTQRLGQTGSISFTVPGVGESSEAYLLTLGGTKRLRHRRVTGGVRVTMKSLPTDAFILLTDDPQAFSQVAKYLRKIAPEATRLRRELASLRLQESTRLLGGNPQAKHWLKQATLELQACDHHLASGSQDLAYSHADAADQILNQVDPMQNATGIGTSSNSGSVASAGQRHLQQRLARAPAGANLLSGGGFENLPALIQAGWRHQQLPLEGITSSVRLSSTAPHSGSYCLELEAKPTNEAAPMPVVPASPVWISTAPVQVQAGDLVEITGVARVPEPLLGTIDGLQLIDSLGGPDMATRIPQTRSWQPFRVIRAVPSDGPITVSIALSGLGRAQIDDLAIRATKDLKARKSTAIQPSEMKLFQPRIEHR
ncbi:MAG: hypothetical protein GXP28_05610 [Planctomycetes bacterium]|nr:hypothetical protein [Planctomycetota bacterium]